MSARITDAEPRDTGGLIVAYRASLERWANLQGNPRAANEEFDRGCELFRQLALSDAGRMAIIELMSHPSPWVRLRAGAHALAWAPEAATEVLAHLMDGQGLFAVSAEYTLREYRAGRLKICGLDLGGGAIAKPLDLDDSSLA
jgi:hypothetical protein